AYEKQEHKQGYLFLTPAIVVLTIFIGLAVLFVFYLSFHKVNLFTGEYEFVGLKNYIRVFNDDMAKIGLKNTLMFSAVVVPIQTVLALIVAAVLNSKLRGTYFFRTVFFLPTLTSSSALTMIFMFMFSVTGPVNNMLIKMNLLDQGINFLQDPSFALKVIMAMNIWSTIPMYTTMYLASLQDLPNSMYEAANIDGAGPIKRFWYITIPYLKPLTTYVLLTSIIGTLQMFDQAYIFSGGSGGPSNSTLTVSLMVYKYAFGTQNAMGYAATLALILAVIIMIISLLAEKANGEERVY
ncbi:MAG: sugar ABC transporter permease, partial [Bacillota bacterium]|nr:sugar ABC transporter permease [Bacillota bacterium]